MLIKITISEEYDGERLDHCLAMLLEGRSRSYIQKLLKDGKVFAENGKKPKASTLVSFGEEFGLDIPEDIVPEIEPQNIPLDVIYEDADVIVINKPKNMVVHPAAGHLSDTLVNALLFHCRDLSGINGILRPGIVHRIDKDTTGLLVVCKNDTSHNFLAEQFKNHTISRTYYALAEGVFKENNGVVAKNLGRDPKNRKKIAVVPDGKRAVTNYEVLEQFPDMALIRCRLETGRTHQIRVHMAAIGHPILGDPVYGHVSKKYQTFGQALHAKTLGFRHPVTGENLEFDSELPEYFQRILDNLRKKQ